MAHRSILRSSLAVSSLLAVAACGSDATGSAIDGGADSSDAVADPEDATSTVAEDASAPDDAAWADAETDAAASCDPGFTSDGAECTDIDECAAAGVCGEHATCDNTQGGYLCSCTSGYGGSAPNCVNTDECTLGTDDCDDNALCADTDGSFLCTCKTGFTGDGKSCGDLNECTLQTDTCYANAFCANTTGAFTCSCAVGLFDDGQTCSPIGQVVINAGQATTASATVTLQLQEPSNLLVNPGSETGDLSGWTVLENGGDGYAIAGVGLFGTRAVVTSYDMFRRSQEIDLLALGFNAAQLDQAPAIAVREWLIGTGGDVADVYGLRVELRRADESLLAFFDTGTGQSSGSWLARGNTFSGYGAGLRKVWFSDFGQDDEFWAGQYGVMFDQASVVVGSVEMRLSNDGTNFGAWTAFTASTPWTLSAGAGSKTVYVEFRNARGGLGPVVSDTIVLQ